MMRRAWVLGILVAVGMSAAIFAEQEPKPVLPMMIEKVKDNLYMISGADGANTGGNTAVFIADKGVVLVDTKYAGYGQAILDKVKTVTDKPITHIINTHTHGDHVGANDFFPASVEIVTHENTATNMAKMKNFAEPAAKHGLPDRTFKDRVTLLSGNDSIDIYYFGPAHTNGDAFIVFRNLRVMHAGDVFPGTRTPLMDANNGGTGIGYPGTLANAIAGVKNVDTVIPGHSPVTNWQAFVDYGEFIKAWVSSVQTAAKAGKPAEQAVSEFVPPEKFKSFGMGSGKANAELIYKELQK
jgi:glyoxylase-like metal-dependent hydrolase (beta-lactamase superfamily II)